MPLFLVFFLSVLGSDAVDVAGEHGAFLDVGDAEEACGDTPAAFASSYLYIDLYFIIIT